MDVLENHQEQIERLKMQSAVQEEKLRQAQHQAPKFRRFLDSMDRLERRMEHVDDAIAIWPQNQEPRSRSAPSPPTPLAIPEPHGLEQQRRFLLLFKQQGEKGEVA